MKKIILLTITAAFIIPFTASAQKTTVTRVNREKAYRTVETENTINEPTPAPKPAPKPTPAPHASTVWYQGEVDLGFAVGGDEATGPILETVHGIRITKYAFAGVGVGLHYLIQDGDPLVPVFADFKFYYPVNKNIAPFLNIDAGSEVCNGGAYLSAGVGLNYKRWNFSVGIRMNDYSGTLGFIKVGFIL